MKNKELFERTVNILVNAYINDHLLHGSCSACVVGNLCGRKMSWSNVFYTCGKTQDFFIEEYVGEAKKQIDSTGYSLDELRKIEYSFETCERDHDDDKYMLNGLMSVIDCLMIIHEANIEETEYAKSLFIKETA